MTEILTTYGANLAFIFLGSVLGYHLTLYMPGLNAHQKYGVDSTPTSSDKREATKGAILGAFGGLIAGNIFFN